MSDLYDYPVVYDVAMEGGIDKQGKIQELWNEDALNNALKMWLSSFEGDLLRQPTRGGYVAPLLLRPMNRVNQGQLEQIVRNGFNEDFRPLLQLRTLQIEPNYEKGYWNTYIEVYSRDLKISTTVNERIKSQITNN